MKHTDRLTSAISLLACAFWLCGPARAAIDIKVNGDLPGSVQNEVSLTLNPSMPGNVVVAYNDFGSAGGGLGVSYSLNYGTTWTDRTLAGSGIITDPVSGVSMNFIFDPISGADTLGNVYAGYIAETGVGAWAGTPSGLYVQSSPDGGNTWNAPVAIHTEPGGIAGSTNVLGGSYRFNDKPHFAADTWAGSPYLNRLYTAWIQDDGLNPGSDILFSASTNSGSSWFPMPVAVSDNPGTDLANGPNVAVASNGTIYVAWLNVDVTNTNSKPATIMFDKSTDGGATFGTNIAVRAIRSLPNQLTTLIAMTDARARSYPSIAVDPANPQEIYLVYAEDPDYTPPSGPDGPDEADVFLIRSTDGGTTWSSPLRINNDATQTDQFEPWVSVDANGVVTVAWYTKQNDPGIDGVWDVYLARSYDYGASFTGHTRVSDNSFQAPGTGFGVWFGEYLGLATDSTSAYIGFTSTFGEVPAAGDIYFDRLFFAAAAVPEPSTALLFLAGALVLFRRPVGRSH